MVIGLCSFCSLVMTKTRALPVRVGEPCSFRVGVVQAPRTATKLDALHDAGRRVHDLGPRARLSGKDFVAGPMHLGASSAVGVRPAQNAEYPARASASRRLRP